MARKSGSLNLKGILETCNRLGTGADVVFREVEDAVESADLIGVEVFAVGSRLVSVKL